MHIDSLPERINRLVRQNEFTIKEKNSEFIAHAFPLESKNDISEKMDEVRKKYFDASHHCFAYKLIDGSSKNSDDGEPKGSAGIRIQNVIDHFELTDILIIVVRYFGGTKLGIGPLGKAYHKAAFQVIENSKIKSLELFLEVRIQADFDNISLVHHFLSLYKGIIAETEYSESVNFKSLIKKNEAKKFIKEINEISKGQINSFLTSNFTYR